MSNMICTDPDTYQWQRIEKDGYSMCQVVSFNDKAYAVLHGTFDPSDDDWQEDVDEIAGFFGYNPDTLRHNEPLYAECIFEYCSDMFVENPYGPSPIYRTPEEACRRCDELMGESHEDMWLTKD